MSREVESRIESLLSNMSKSRKKAELQQDSRKFPLLAEPALVHPLTTSTMKVRDNGMIDIFVGTDNGIRLDPETKTINFLSNNFRTKSVYEWIETKKNRVENVGGDLIHNVGQEEIHNVKGIFTLHTGKSIRLVSDGDIYMEARDKIHMKSPHIVLDGTIPEDQFDPVRPVLGLMFEDEKPYGETPPFGYKVHGEIKNYEKKPRYRREEYDDLHEDEYEKSPYLPFIRDKEFIRKDTNKETLGPIYRKAYRESKIEIKANRAVNIRTLEKDGDIILDSARNIEFNENQK